MNGNLLKVSIKTQLHIAEEACRSAERKCPPHTPHWIARVHLAPANLILSIQKMAFP